MVYKSDAEIKAEKEAERAKLKAELLAEIEAENKVKENDEKKIAEAEKKAREDAGRKAGKIVCIRCGHIFNKEDSIKISWFNKEKMKEHLKPKEDACPKCFAPVRWSLDYSKVK